MTVQALWALCPSGSRLVLLAYPLLSVVMTVLGGIVTPLQVLLPKCSAHVVLPVLGRGFVWALPLSLLHRPLQFGPAALMVFFEIYMGASLLPTRERALGSTTFVCWLMVISTLMSSIFIVMMLLLSPLLGPVYLAMPIQGLWPVIMVCLSLRSLSKPDEQSNFWGVVQIPNKWYPVLLTVFFSLMSGRIMFDFVAAIGVGYMYERLKIDRLVVGQWWVSALDRRINGEGLLGGTWVPLGGAPAPGEAEIESGGGGSVYSSGSRAGRAAQPSFHVFSGSGQRLGES